MRLIITLIIILLSGCTKYIPAECPEPPEIKAFAPAPIDQTLPPNQQVREMVIRYGQCLDYAKQTSIALEVYKK